MAQLIRNNDVKIETKDGELKIHLTLDLNINLNTGALTAEISPKKPLIESPQETTEKEIDYALPNFTSTVGKLKFGKTE